MKWPFARHAHPSSAPAAGGVGAIATADPPRTDESQRQTAHVLAPSRRDWATLPPLKVAGARPINLTVQARAFTESLASQQVLVHSPRLEHVRHIDSPSGSFRGILAPAVADLDGSGPDVQEPSPLPSIEHRHLAALSGEQGPNHGLSPVDQLLAIGEPPAGGATPIAPGPRSQVVPIDVDDSGGDGGTMLGGTACRPCRFAAPRTRSGLSRPVARGDACRTRAGRRTRIRVRRRQRSVGGVGAGRRSSHHA